MLPDAGSVDEERVPAAACGPGYGLLQASDPVRSAVLLKALGTSLGRTPMPPETKLVALTGTRREAWTLPLSTAPRLPTVTTGPAACVGW